MCAKNYLIHCVEPSKCIFITFAGDADLEMSDTSDDSDEDDSGSNSPSQSDVQSTHKSLLTLQSNEPLGNWERHTRGIGSKLMMQMGYVVGTGLGKRGDGRIQPVEATVLPAGKSLGSRLTFHRIYIAIYRAANSYLRFFFFRSLYGIA